MFWWPFLSVHQVADFVQQLAGVSGVGVLELLIDLSLLSRAHPGSPNGRRPTCRVGDLGMRVARRSNSASIEIGTGRAGILECYHLHLFLMVGPLASLRVGWARRSLGLTSATRRDSEVIVLTSSCGSNSMSACPEDGMIL